MMGMIWFLQVFLTFYEPSVYSDGAPAKAFHPIKNCRITIESLLASGRTESKIYLSTQPNRRSCENLARLHENNFAPKLIRKKKASAEWLTR